MSSCHLVKKEKKLMDYPGLIRAQGTFRLIIREEGIFPCLSGDNDAQRFR